MATSTMENPNPPKTLKYIDITDTHPMNITTKTSWVVTKDNLVGVCPQTGDISVTISRHVVDSKENLYCELHPFKDPTGTVVSSCTIRVWYWG